VSACFGKPTGDRTLKRLVRLPSERAWPLQENDPAQSIEHFCPPEGPLLPRLRRRRAPTNCSIRQVSATSSPRDFQTVQGIYRKVQILSTLRPPADFLILDEPFSGLGPVNQQVLEDDPRRGTRAAPTILFSYPVIGTCRTPSADRIVMMARGPEGFRRYRWTMLSCSLGPGARIRRKTEGLRPCRRARTQGLRGAPLRLTRARAIACGILLPRWHRRPRMRCARPFEAVARRSSASRRREARLRGCLSVSCR